MGLERWNDAELAGAIDQGRALLVDLRADWCPQCGPQEGVLERVAPEFEGLVTFGSVDVGLHPSVLDTYGVRGLPALLLFNNGQLKETINGFKRAPVIRLALKNLMNS
jgi:thioredoxin 1